MNLSELQRLLHARITGLDTTRDEDLRREVVAREPLGPLERVQIYARMYLFRLVDALSEDLPLTERLLGHDRFVELVERYLRDHPSRSPDIAQVGRQFGPWLRSVAGLRPDLPDLAMLERARAEVRTELDAPVAGPEALQALSPEALPRVRFLFIPALRVLPLEHDVQALWDALDKGEPAPPVEPAPAVLVVWRQEFKVFHTRIGKSEARALAKARDGGRLEDLCDPFVGQSEPAQAAFRTLLSWFADGWVSAVSAGD
jgi:hypothetical protein